MKYLFLLFLLPPIQSFNQSDNYKTTKKITSKIVADMSSEKLLALTSKEIDQLNYFLTDPEIRDRLVVVEICKVFNAITIYHDPQTTDYYAGTITEVEALVNPLIFISNINSGSKLFQDQQTKSTYTQTITYIDDKYEENIVGGLSRIYDTNRYVLRYITNPDSTYSNRYPILYIVTDSYGISTNTRYRMHLSYYTPNYIPNLLDH